MKGLECRTKGFGLDLVTPACLPACLAYPHRVAFMIKTFNLTNAKIGTKAALTTWSFQGLPGQVVSSLDKASSHPRNLQEVDL